jgi:AcrR family transcriptional regulator
MSMPRYVDHDERRRHIAATAAELVGARGLEALTFRNVAEAAGSSTTVLTHYFTDKRDLLSSTFEVVAERSGARFDDAQRNGGSLRECLEALLPLDSERQTEWRLLTCYWGMGVSDPVAAGEQARHVRSAQRRIETLLRQHYPEIAGAELEVVARRLVTLVHGLGAHSALDPVHWSAADQRRVLAHELSSLGGLDGHDGGTPTTTSPDGPAAAAASSSDGPAAAAAGHRARPLKRAGAGSDAAARRLRKDLLAAVKQGPSPVARRRRRPFSA